ncbi:TPA: ABC transporter ATP-binding protein [Bacillus cereus]
MSNNSIVVFNKVDKSIGKQEILKNVTFNVEKGEVIGIIGANGSGKTTILRLASGLSYTTNGEIFIEGKIVKPGMVGNLPSGVGILIESPNFIGHLTGFENLYYLSKIRNEINENDIYETLKEVGLDPKNKKKVHEYSLGMRQRLGIAQAIMEKPNLILLDEPTNALDKEGVELFAKIINKYKNMGISFIFVSHSTEEIQRFCDRVFKIENRGLLLQNTIQDWHIILENLEDIERVLQLKADARIGERHNGKPVVIAPFQEKLEMVSFFDRLNIKYEILRDE